MSSILERETSHGLRVLDTGFVGERPLTVGGEESNGLPYRSPNQRSYYDSMTSTLPPAMSESYASSTITAGSSSLNTTVIEK